MKVVSKNTGAHKRTTNKQLNPFASRFYCTDDASCVYKEGGGEKKEKERNQYGRKKSNRLILVR